MGYRAAGRDGRFATGQRWTAAFFGGTFGCHPTATDWSMLGQILVFVIGVTQGSGTSRCGHGRSRCLSLAKFLFISFDNHHASHQHDMVVHLSGGHLPEASFVVVFGTPRLKELSILTSRIWCHSEKSPFPFLEPGCLFVWALLGHSTRTPIPVEDGFGPYWLTSPAWIWLSVLPT